MSATDSRIETGVRGLDHILKGGLPDQRAYLLRGGPGSGKTTLGLHFLLNGPAEESLFITLGESEEQLRANGSRAGLPMDGVSVLDLSPGQPGAQNASYSLLESWDVEGNAMHDDIVQHVKARRPTRIVIDSLSLLHFLSSDIFQFRKQAMSLLRALTDEGATVLFTSEMTPREDEQTLPYLSDGIITLESTDHGRLCRIDKLRGSDFEKGWHFYHLAHGGMTVFPRLLPEEHGRTVEHETLPFNIPALDALSHGGIERGTVNMLSGPTGVGKTTLGAQFMAAAAARQERSVIYSFDERASTFFTRCRQLGMPVEEQVEAGTLRFQGIEPLRYNPDQFAEEVREEVEKNGTTMVMLDSLSGYQHSVRGRDLQERVHALCRYLTNMGVTVILVNEVFALTGNQARVSEYGLSYIADNIILLRYIELSGELRKTVGMLKKRAGSFERSLREFDIQEDGVHVGEPLSGLRGILSGTPEMTRDGQR
jgi:circadian clock protein KaiC